MHESLIVNRILEQVNKKANGKKVKSITIEVGDLAHLPAKELHEFIKTMVDFEVVIEPKKARVKCECGFEGEPKILAHEHDLVLFECPKCGKTPKILSGEEIVLKEIITE